MLTGPSVLQIASVFQVAQGSAMVNLSQGAANVFCQGPDGTFQAWQSAQSVTQAQLQAAIV